jgi:hypothetical protein
VTEQFSDGVDVEPEVDAVSESDGQVVGDQHDEDVDAELDRLDDGSGSVGPGAASPEVARSEALPFVLTAREHFASVGDVEITGEARVDAATARLEEIADLPTSDHVAVYDDVHRRLQDALSDAEVR